FRRRVPIFRGYVDRKLKVLSRRAARADVQQARAGYRENCQIAQHLFNGGEKKPPPKGSIFDVVCVIRPLVEIKHISIPPGRILAREKYTLCCPLNPVAGSAAPAVWRMFTAINAGPKATFFAPVWMPRQAR